MIARNRSKSAGMLQRVALAGVVLGMLASVAFGDGGPNVDRAKSYIQQNDLEQAIKVLTKEIDEVDANNGDAWYLLGYIYARQEKYDKMLEAFNKALELKPNFAEKGVNIEKDTGNLILARLGVDRILKIAGAVAFNTGVRHFNDAINTDDDSARAAEFDIAITNFKAAAKIEPENKLPYINLAATLMNAGKQQEAVKPLEKAVAIDPKDTERKLLLALVYMGNDSTDAALKLMEELWADNVRTDEAADQLSLLYVRTGQIDKAREIYKEAIASNPDDYRLRLNYGSILLESRDYDGAIEQLSKAYAIDSTSADINYNLGAAYLNRGVDKRDKPPEDSDERSYMADFKLAFPYLEKSVKLNPDESKIWFALGRIAGQLNKISLAGYAFSKGERTKSALDQKVIVGMPSETLKMVLGEPDKVSNVESEQFSNVEEWVYKSRPKSAGKIAIATPINVYIANGRVDALMVDK